MAVTSQRLMTIAIILSLVTGIAMDIYLHPYDSRIDRVQELQLSMNDQEQSLESESASAQITSQQEQTMGNTLNMGLNIFWTFLKGITPIPIIWETFTGDLQVTTTVETMFIMIAILVKALTTGLIAMELYMIIKNSKPS